MMEESTVRYILEELNRVCEIDYCSLNETEVVAVILKAEKDNIAHLKSKESGR